MSSNMLSLTIGAVIGAGFKSSISTATSSIEIFKQKVKSISSIHLDIKALKRLKAEGKESSEEFATLSGKLKKAKIDTTNLDQSTTHLANKLKLLHRQSKIDIKISANTEKIKSEISSIKGSIASLAGVIALAKSAATVEQAKGEIASLGISETGIIKISDMATKFSNQYAGTDAADIIKASYDIKSGIASLSDEGVADFTRLAALTGIATKSSTAEMTKTFALGYGVFRDQFKTDEEFGEKFSVAISSSVQSFRTTGSDLASSIARLGAVATSKGVSLSEQFATIGVLKDTFDSASEAATGYTAFLRGVARAQDSLGLSFTDSQGKMLPTVDIIEKIKLAYSENINTMEVQTKLQESFGDEGVKVLLGLVNKTDKLRVANSALQTDMEKGSKTTDMAEAMQRGKGFELLGQRMKNAGAGIGKFFLPPLLTISKVIGYLAGGIVYLSDRFPKLSYAVAFFVVGIIGISVAISITRIAIAGLTISKLTYSKILTNVALKLNIFNLRLRLTSALATLTTVKLRIMAIATMLVGKGMQLLSFGVSIASKAFSFFSTIIRVVGIALMSNPIGLILSGIAIVAGLIIMNWDKVKQWFIKFINWIAPVFEPIINSYKEIWGGIFNWFKVSYETLSQFKIYENNIHSCYYDENGFLTFELEIDYLADLQKYIYGVALINEKIASEEDANGVLQNIIKRTIVSLSNSGKIFKSSGVGGLYIYKVNVTGNKAEIIYQNNDYINLETAQMMDRDTLNNAKQFADNQDTINLQTAKTYADDKDELKLSKVNNLADLTDQQVARDNLNVYEKREVDVALNNKSNINHIHESLIKVYTTYIRVNVIFGSSQHAVPVTWTEILSLDNGLRKLQGSATVTVLGLRPFLGVLDLSFPRNIIISQSNITMTGLACTDGTPITSSSIMFSTSNPPPITSAGAVVIVEPRDKDIIFTFHLDAVIA